jgi:hypothetical protein
MSNINTREGRGRVLSISAVTTVIAAVVGFAAFLYFEGGPAPVAPQDDPTAKMGKGTGVSTNPVTIPPIDQPQKPSDQP